MTHRFSDRIIKYSWLDTSLADFYWQAQPAYVRESVVSWLEAWYRRLFLKEARPPTILSLWGTNGVGKTTVAKGIAHFHILNLACADTEFIPWGIFVDDQLNGQQIHPNWNAQMLIIDGLDKRRPVPESRSTWLLDKLSDRLEYRAEILHYPTITTSHRNPSEMAKFLTTSTTGQTDEHVLQSAHTLIEAFSSHLFATVEFKFSHELRAKCSSDQEFNKRLQHNARKQNMHEMGFHFLEKYNEETWWNDKENLS